MVPNNRPVAAPLVTRGAALFPLLLLSCMVLSSAADTLPSFVKSPQNQTGVSGEVASFVCQATGEPKPRITWMKNGEEVSSSSKEVIEFDGGAGSVLRIEPLNKQQNEAIYRCTATNSVGQISTSAKLTVIEEDQIPDGFPTIDVHPQLRAVEKTRATIMVCGASGNPDVKISWFKDMLPVDIDGSNGRIKQLHTEATGILQIGDSRESDEGKYECVATNSAGTRYSSPASLYVRVRRSPPRFIIPPVDQEVSPGENVTLTCVAEGMPVPYVKWIMSTWALVSFGQELTKEDEIPLERNVLEVTNIRESANYTCVAESSLGRIEATAQVAVKGLPSFVKSLVDQTGIFGGVASFLCQATGEPKPRITWTKNGKKVNSQRLEVIEFDDGSASILRIQPLRTHRDEGIYECTATNSAGEISSNAKLTVLEEHQIRHGFPTIDVGPQLRVVEMNLTAVMVCTASGNPDPEISWYKDMLPVDINSSNGRIKQLHSGALQIENSEESDQGKYECVATNRAGTRYSAPANLYVRVRNVPPRFSIRPTNEEVMPGGSVNLTCEAVGSPMPYVKWIIHEEDLTMETRTSLGRNVMELKNIRQSANYTCLATSLLGFIVATAQVTVKSLPKPLTSFTVAETTATSVTLTWDSGNTEPVSYMIQYRAKASDGSFQRVEGVATTRYTIEGLRPYSEYQFRVMPMNSVGQGPPSDTVETRTAEQAPSSPPLQIQVRMLSASAMLVQWEPPEEPNGLIIGYRVYYSKDLTAPLSAWKKHNTDDSSLTAISGLIPNTTYSLGVLGFTSVGDGPLSDILQVNLQQRELPKPLTSLTVTETTATSVTLAWDSGNTAPLSYMIQYRAKASDDSFQQVEGVATTRYTIRGLRPYSEYQFRVMAVNNIGRGPPSDIVETQTGEHAPSSPPLNVQARMLSASAMLVQWEPPEDPNGLIIGYRVYYSKDLTAPLSAWQKRNIADGRVSAISGLIPNTAYGLRVLGFTSVGDGPLSDILQVNVQQRVPAQPSSFDAEAELDDRIMLTWLWPVPDDITQYELVYWEAGSDTKIIKVFEPTNSYAVDGLKPDTLYRFILAGRSEFGLRNLTQPIEARTAQSMLAAPPRRLEAEALNSTAIRVTWKPPLQQKQQGQILGYQVIFSRLENGEPRGPPSIMDMALPEAQEAIIDGLHSETSYAVAVAAYTTKADGARSKAKVITTTGAVPGKPRMTIRIVNNNVVIVWQPPNEMVGPLIGYQLQYKRTDDENFTSKEISLPLLQQYSVAGLHKGATYIFRLSARSRAGIGEACIKEIRTPEDIPSGFPINLQVTEVTQSSMHLIWEPPLLAERNGKIISYVVRHMDINNQQISSYVTTEPYLIIQYLNPDTTYDIRVQAQTSKGSGPLSPSIQSRTLASP